MSDDTDPATASAIALLERFQLRQYRNLGVEPLIYDGADEASVDGIINEISTSFGIDPEDLRSQMEAVTVYGKSIPGSRFDNPATRGHMNQTAAELEKFLLKPPAARPLFGELPSASPNALVAYDRTSKRHVIMLQRGQFEFFGASAKSLAHACTLQLPFGQYRPAELANSPNWINDDNVYARSFPWFFEAILAAMTGDRGSAREIVNNVCTEPCGTSFRTYQLTLEEKKKSLLIADCITTFAIGHEYGHVVGEDAFKITEHFGAIPGLTEGEFREFLSSMVDEKIADDIGAGLAIRRNSAEGYDIELSHLGITLFFDLMIFFQDCLDVMKTGAVRKDRRSLDSWTHPPLEVRRKEIEAAISRHVGRQELTDRGLVLSNSFRVILSHFWILAKPLFEAAHEDGLERYLAPEHR